MPFDTFALAAILDEARDHVLGARIQRIVQPSSLSIALSLYGNRRTSWMLLSADPRYARITLSADRFAKAFEVPSPFVMLLRKHLEGARVAEIEQVRGERIARLAFTHEAPTKLVAEIMGRHSNVILLTDNRVLGAIKMVTDRQSRIRTILPGRPYVPPPEQRASELFRGRRLDPGREPGAVLAALRLLPPQTELRPALLGLLAGISPFLAGQIVRAAGLPMTATVDAIDLDDVVRVAAAYYRLAQSHDWAPTIFVNERGRADFAPYMPLGMSNVRRAESMSVAIEEAVGADESRDSLAVSRRRVMAEVQRRLSAAESRLRSLREALPATEEAEEVMEQGQLLLAYQHLPREPDSITIPDLGVTIPLQRELTIRENAERLFKRYRKLRDAARRVPGLVSEAERQLAQLHELAAFVELAESESDLRDLERQLHPVRPEPKSKKGPAPRRPPRLQLDGYVAIFGRNARENEEVTFSEARRDDLWLHARGRTGAHVLLRPGAAPDDVVAAAAALAAYQSEGRNDSAVDVDVAPVRNVRRVAGGPPGRVTYRDFETLRVKPARDPWRPA